jgi:hypothetical protein
MGSAVSAAGHGAGRCIPLGPALAVFGGALLLAAFFMPWLGISSPQGSVTLTGEFLLRFLSQNSDLRAFMPGAGPVQARALLGLVAFFPAVGGLVALAGLAAALWPARPRWLSVAFALLGLAAFIALLVGQTQLPPTTTGQVGLKVIGLGAALVLVGGALDARQPREAGA